jgi:hypothetical protein
MCKAGEESMMLTEFESSVRKGSFDDLIENIDRKRFG